MDVTAHNDRPLWVFGYGSLMWEPGFGVAERQIARLSGYHRSFCMWSIHHRGTEDDPGLVLALDARHDAVCDGVALQATPGTREATLDYLRERELVSSAYNEAVCAITLQDGREVDAVTYVMNTEHVQYCGELSLEDQAQVIAKARGGRGPNTEYLFNTAAHLIELGVEDPEMAWLVERVQTLLTA